MTAPEKSATHLQARELPAWQAPDGTAFGYKRWPARNAPDTPPRAALIAIHGISGSVEDFEPLGQYFAPRNYAVYSWNYRGMGFDPNLERRGDLRDFSKLTQDLRAFTQFVREREPEGTPVVLVGESLGSAIAVQALLEEPALARALVLIAPVLRLRPEMAWYQRLMFRAFLFIAPGKRLNLSDLGDSDAQENGPGRVTRLESRQQALIANEPNQPRFTLAALAAMVKFLNDAGDRLDQLAVPVLVNYAGDDIFMEPGKVETLFRNALPEERYQLKLYNEARHHLLFDPLTPDMLEATRRWLERQDGP
jgi:alpha-beta hydrolase superfamily lysophospholipase